MVMQRIWKAVMIAIVLLAMAATILYIPKKLYQHTGSGTIDCLLALLLAAVALVGSIAAIGGDTITKDINAPIYRRLTLRGFVAIACIVLTFGLESIKDKVSMDEDRIKSTQHSQVRVDITEFLATLQLELSENHDLLTGEKKEMENKMDFTKGDLQQLKIAIETSEQKSQNQISALKTELGPLTDKDHGLQAQISALNSVLTDNETENQPRITATTGAGQDPQSTFASDFKNGLD
jgi:hypothetical protein